MRVQGKPLPVYGDGKPNPRLALCGRSLPAIYLVIKTANRGDVYTFCGGNQPLNIDLVHELCSILDELKPTSVSYKDLITYVPDRPGHDRRYAMDITKIWSD